MLGSGEGWSVGLEVGKRMEWVNVGRIAELELWP